MLDTITAEMYLNSTEHQMFTTESILAAIPLIFVIFFTIVGNIMVIMSIFTYRPLRNVQNMYLVSLSVSDIGLALTVMILNVAYLLAGKWVFGLFLCKFWLTCDVLMCTASILNLCVIACDRYWAIHDPINYAQKRTMKRILRNIAVVWIVSAIVSIPPLLGWNDWPDTFTEDTPCHLSTEKGYLLYSSMITFYIPLVIMTTVYVKIYLATKRRLRERASQCAAKLSIAAAAKRSQALSTTTENVVIEVQNCETTLAEKRASVKSSESSSSTEAVEKQSSPKRSAASKDDTSHKMIDQNSSSATKSGSSENRVNSVVKQHWEERQRISLSRERKAARVLGIVMGVFVACWLPFFIMYLMPFFTETQLSHAIEQFIVWLGYVNSVLNPIIYTRFNSDFRKAFRKILSCTLNY
ncbi:putative G-protein coupled receptor No18-like protein [Dinothrombium tinctorium]|uniref:Putative G-protein coupled receptor No18-like protein n=1 Tax=Dinothrombium tinctorium TaxID=1965070 RepID=A0A443QIS3_9ACAR|nr:putative G-protein coupled receptor No18-like protein [Dinothrombium tinctorium]